MRTRSIAFATVVAVGLLGTWWFSHRPGQSARASSIQRIRRVVTAPAILDSAPVERRAYGTVRARDRAVLAFTVGGRLQTRGVEVGDRVKRGQVIARLDARGYSHAASAAEARLAQAGAQLGQHQRDEARLSLLRDERAISAEQVERIGAAVQGADAAKRAADVQLREAKRTLRETLLRAPFDGIVVAVHLQPKELAASGQPVVTLSGDADFEVEVQLPGRIANKVRVGDSAGVQFPMAGVDPVQASVRSVGQSTAGRGQLFPVVVSWPMASTPQIRPGTAADLRLATAVPPALTVPAAAILAPAGVDAAVLRVRDHRVERVPVTLGEVRGQSVVVEGELAAQDLVVVAGYAGLLEGDRVEVTP